MSSLASNNQNAMREALVDQSPAALFWASDNGELLDINQTFLKLVGVDSRTSVINTPLDRFFVEPSVCKQAFSRLAFQDTVTSVEVRLRRPDGNVIVAILGLHRGNAKGTAGVAGTLRDVTAWNAMLDGASEQAERYRTIVMSMSLGAVMLDGEGNILTCNPAAERILGMTAEEMAGVTPHDLWRSIHEDGTPFERADRPIAISLRTSQPCNNILQGVHRPDGRLVWILINSVPLFHRGQEQPDGVVATFVDVTEQRTLEVQFHQAQKLDALGHLAGGIAHDFNNMLTVIFNRSELLLRRLPVDDRNHRLANEILAAARQSADLTQQLLAAARKQVLQLKVVDLITEIREGMRFLTRSIGENIIVRTVLDDETWRVFADPGKLRQVLMNLVLNARDAMPGGGTLTIETRNFVADAAYVRRHPLIHHGEYVMVTVSDTGSGIAPEHRDKIYDPFFTTKPVGKGTGLGLAVVRGIVEQTGGHITVYSEVGRGTTFKIYFPRYDGDVEQLRAAAQAETPRGSETILLVEDEELVREVLRETLEEQGYTVLEATDGKSALEVTRAHQGRIDLVISDVMMPVMSGPELGELLTALHPELRMIFMSGYSDSAIEHHGIVDRKAAFLEKPVMAGSLLSRVRQVLDGPQPASA
jgi:two-component system, cell cycle sensor histidine kinase and response regulator CckA